LYFDGLIIETEAIYYHIWQREFRKVGLAFDIGGIPKPHWRPSMSSGDTNLTNSWLIASIMVSLARELRLAVET